MKLQELSSVGLLGKWLAHLQCGLNEYIIIMGVSFFVGNGCRHNQMERLYALVNFNLSVPACLKSM